MTKIDSLLDEIKGLHQTIKHLSNELDAERSAHANSRAHLNDDREHLRSTVVHRLKREISLLTDGLHALHKNPPKVHVMNDHAERVLDSLQTIIQELEDKD